MNSRPSPCVVCGTPVVTLHPKDVALCEECKKKTIKNLNEKDHK